MIHRLEAAIFFNSQPECIVYRLSVLELTRLLQFAHQLLVANTRLIEITIPERQVLNSRKEAGSADVSIRKDVILEESVAVWLIRISAVLDDFFVVCMEVCIFHPQW